MGSGIPVFCFGYIYTFHISWCGDGVACLISTWYFNYNGVGVPVGYPISDSIGMVLVEPVRY